MRSPIGKSVWPDLALPTLSATLEPLHLWTQMVGKVKLACLPWISESWHITLYVSATGLTTGLMTHGPLGFELAFDMRDQILRLTTSSGARSEIALRTTTVAEFHAELVAALHDAGLAVTISPRPSEIEGAVAFAEDRRVRDYDPQAARAWWLALIQVQRVFGRFRSQHTGKTSPIHLFWGGFDLAVTRFSGRPAPLFPRSAPNMSLAVAQDAYAGELASFGFWPGGHGVDGPSFYIEAWPVPPGFGTALVRPSAARFESALDEWLLSYADLIAADDPDAALLEFLESGYAAIAEGGNWPRDMLDRDEGPIGHPPPLRRAL